MHYFCHECVQSRLIRLIAIAVAMSIAAGCELGSPAGPSSSVSVNHPAELAYCADEVNRYRASVGQGPLLRSQALEDFASQAAKNDGLNHIAHHHFATTNGGGTAMAETEILWWRGYGVRSVIHQGLAQMWKGGPDGEHYGILAGSYTQVGCGVFVNGSEVTVAQDFR